MQMIPVNSSTVAAIGYDQQNQILRVEWKNRTAGDYLKFTRKDYANFNDVIIAHGSIQNYIRKQIIPNHEYVKLSIHETTNGRKGYLVEAHKVETNNPIKADTPAGKCPACQTEAQGFDQPFGDPNYVNRIAQEKELGGFESDKDAVMAFLKHNGGYIEICKCGNSFWVPFRLAKIKGL